MRKIGPFGWPLALLLAALVILPGTAPAQEPECSSEATNGNFTLTFKGVTYNGDGSSTWEYCLTWNGESPALSHLTIGMCEELTDEYLMATEPMGAAIGPDGSSGLYGLKWDYDPGLAENQCFDFSFTLSESFDAGPVRWIAKAGPGRELGPEICGPSLDCTPIEECIEEEATLILDDYETVAWDPDTLIWEVRMSIRNLGPGTAYDVSAELLEEIDWLVSIVDDVDFPDIGPGETIWSENAFKLDLGDRPGPGGFNVFFNVTYQTNCGDGRFIMLDPEANPPGEGAAKRLHTLGQNHPNPFNPQTTIHFALGKQSPVTLRVYDQAGRMVRELVNGTLAATQHSVIWDGKDQTGRTVRSGVYFYRLDAGDFTETRRMLLVK